SWPGSSPSIPERMGAPRCSWRRSIQMVGSESVSRPGIRARALSLPVSALLDVGIDGGVRLVEGQTYVSTESQQAPTKHLVMGCVRPHQRRLRAHLRLWRNRGKMFRVDQVGRQRPVREEAIDDGYQ